MYSNESNHIYRFPPFKIMFLSCNMVHDSLNKHFPGRLKDWDQFLGHAVLHHRTLPLELYQGVTLIQKNQPV